MSVRLVDMHTYRAHMKRVARSSEQAAAVDERDGLLGFFGWARDLALGKLRRRPLPTG